MRRLRFLVAGILSAAMVAASTAPASAAPPPDNRVSPIECLEAWENDPDYLNDGWVDAVVMSVPEVGVTLTCGDVRSGVIHIAHEESTGNGHPITRESAEDFLYCLFNTVVGGVRSDDPKFPATRVQYESTYYGYAEIMGVRQLVQQKARAFVDRERGFVWTFHTSKSSEYPRSNNWADCSGNPTVV
jgi:hypothetical protein